MQPILAVEYRVKVGEDELNEESVPLHNPEELLAFVAPGGGCERIPSEVENQDGVSFAAAPECQQSACRRGGNPAAGYGVFKRTPLRGNQTTEQLLDKAGRGELSRSFLTVIGAG